MLGPAASKAELLDGLARALEFPGWVGRNWDALADALGDLSWLPAGPKVVVWAGWMRSGRPNPPRTGPRSRCSGTARGDRWSAAVR